jgi:hypothetical protein
MQILSDPGTKYSSKTDDPLATQVRFIVYSRIDGMTEQGLFASLINTTTNQPYVDTPALLMYAPSMKIVNKDKKNKRSLTSGQILDVTGIYSGFLNYEGLRCMHILCTKIIVLKNIVEE